jgi:hypothetical protein
MLNTAQEAHKLLTLKSPEPLAVWRHSAMGTRYIYENCRHGSVDAFTACIRCLIGPPPTCLPHRDSSGCVAQQHTPAAVAAGVSRSSTHRLLSPQFHSQVKGSRTPMRHSSMADKCYLFCSWLENAGVLDKNPTLKKRAALFYLIGLTAGLFIELKGLLDAHAHTPSSSEGRAALNARKRAHHIQILSTVCDQICALSTLEWISVSNGVTGLAGATSAFFGVRQALLAPK